MMKKKSYEKIFYDFVRKMVDEKELTDDEVDSILISNFIFGNVIMIEWAIINNTANIILKAVKADVNVVS